MKKRSYLLPAIFFVLLACNNSGNKTGNTDAAMADSLMDHVMDGHDIGMAKMPKLGKAQERAQQVIDSIAKLPATAQQAAIDLKTKMESLLKDLNYADFAMNKWMSEFNYDSMKNDLSQRIQYLTGEKLKVEKMKEAILNSLAKADSLLKPGNK